MIRNKYDILAEVTAEGACLVGGPFLRTIFGDTNMTATGVQAAVNEFCREFDLSMSMLLGSNGEGSDAFVFTRKLL